MTLSFRPLASIAVVLAAGSPIIAQTASPSGPDRITAAANLTLRAMPAPDAAAVAQLPLGSEIANAGPAGLDKTWVRVRTADGREGWLLARLTRPLDPVWRWPVFDGIITDRLGRRGDGFPAVAELVAFIERVAPEYTDQDGRARIELARLQALSLALSLVPFRGAQREPFASWLNARQNDVVYDEPGGRWMLSPKSVWSLQARHATTSAADELAWFGVQNGLPGECEGYLPCYLDARNLMEGEYLRRAPLGRHAAEAVAEIQATADRLAAPPKPHAAYAFDRARDCRDVGKSLDALVAAVQAAPVAGRDTALASLANVKKLCQPKAP